MENPAATRSGSTHRQDYFGVHRAAVNDLLPTFVHTRTDSSVLLGKLWLEDRKS